jgi:hypothetical protein
VTSTSPLPAAAGRAAWLDFADFTRLRARPQWLPLLACTVALYSVMPVVHVATFGSSRMAAAVVRTLEEATGASIGGASQAQVRADIERRPAAVVAATACATSLLAVVLAGVALNIGTLLILAELSAAQAFSVAALSSLAVGVLRLVGWLAVVAVLGRDAAAAYDWLHVAPANLAILVAPDATPVWRTLLGGCDVYYATGVVVSAIGIRTMDPTVAWTAALVASVGWVAVIVAVRLAVAALVGIAIF